MNRLPRRSLLAIVMQLATAAGGAAVARPAPVASGQLGLAVPLHELVDSFGGDMSATFAQYARLGVRWVRTDFWWNQVQPAANGGYAFSALDRVVTNANRHGIKIVAELQGLPQWVSGTGGVASAANKSAYVSFAAAAARHFRGKVRYWEIWNEPNLQGFWGAQPDAADYTRLLKAAYTAIKAVDPDTVVITGGLSPAPETAGDHVGAVEFFKQMYANGAHGFFDAVGFHPYSWPLMPGDPASWNGFRIMRTDIRDTMVANGDGAKRVWITEFGAPTNGSRAVTERQQAANLEQASEFAHATPWAGPLFWYTYQDRGGSTADTENWFGLVGPKGEHKLSYRAYRDIAGDRLKAGRSGKAETRDGEASSRSRPTDPGL